MRTRCVIREALRSIVCVAFAYVIFFQALAGAVSGGAMAAHKTFGLDQLSVICSSDGPKRAEPDGAPQQSHGGRSDCCAWACPETLVDGPEPVATSFHEIKPDIKETFIWMQGHTDARVPLQGSHRTQAARAPPSLQS
jgi:hypothetical protein